MIALTAEEAGQALGLAPLAAGVPGVSIDSRSIRPGELFVALQGENFDGHDFVAAALAAGASGAVVAAPAWAERRHSAGRELPVGADVLIYPVEDSLAALGALARAVRRKSSATVVAITGSVGKTTTKDLVTAMAGRVRAVVATEANNNNEIGVPLTLLGIEPATEIVVVEMGMRGRGQIATLAGIAEPDVGLVINIHQVHLETLGSLEDIAEAKAELFGCLGAKGVAVVPVDCERLGPRAQASGCRVVRFGLGLGSEGAEIRGISRASASGTGAVVSLEWAEGKVDIETPFASRHRLEDTVAAAAACYAAGLPLERCAAGVAGVRLSGSRGDVMRLTGLCVINDTYNASPASMRAALDDLVDLAAQTGGRPVAVLGDMLELGPDAERLHRETGTYAAAAGVRALWGVGPLSEATVEGYRAGTGPQTGSKAVAGDAAGHARPLDLSSAHLSSAEEASRIMAGLRAGDVVLFKASRNMRLEVAVTQVVAEAQAGTWGEMAAAGEKSLSTSSDEKRGPRL